ncbi:S-adenosyl-L-methionine-dependent methyltransferase [Rickenella mellea]|uniref:phosphoethanolamine N-methyltransferase n=1 Tax=Rickenella mellea TaxID=50990 RepID=A0A4Y7QMV2_9AGAM|nr:S-adenosyl-L-methionine-dependent methyltransferase [Rickenella mellea]
MTLDLRKRPHSIITFICISTPILSLIYTRNILLSTACLVCIAIAVTLYPSLQDPYGSFHLSLNRPPGADHVLPKSEWLNMGYWKDTDSFPNACEALCLKLTHAAKLAAGDRVLDVGHGSGDSLILLLSHPSIPPLSRLAGITSLRFHHDRSAQRIGRRANPPVTLYLGDAVYHDGDGDHPMEPSPNHPQFDAILALDCAYHFQTREKFLQQAFNSLDKGGRIALADICLPRSSSSRSLTSLFVKLKPPFSRTNMVSIAEYSETMKRIGYQDVVVEDISTYVFPGFRAFLRSRSIGWRIFEKVLGLYLNAGARYIIASGTKPYYSLTTPHE